MEFFSFLRRRRAPQTTSSDAQPLRKAKVESAPLPSPPLQLAVPVPPDEVHRLLFDAVAAGDERKLDALCKEHHNVILSHAEGWLEVPPEFKTNPEISEWYAKGLAAIARYCAERLADKAAIARTASPDHRPGA